MSSTAGNLRVTLTNVHSDNFGDHLNAQTALRFFEDRLGATVTDALYAGTAWEAEAPLPDHVRHHIVASPFDDPMDDLLHHHLGLEHKCPNAELWHRHRQVAEYADLVVSVPSGEAIGVYRDARFLVPSVAATAVRTPSMMFYGTVHGSGSPSFDDVAHIALSDTHVRVRDRASLTTIGERGFTGFGGLDPTFLEAAHRADRVSGVTRPVLTVVLGDTMGWHPSASQLERGVEGPSARELLVRAISDLELPEGLSIELVPHSPLASELEVLETAATTIRRRHDVVVRRDVTSVDAYIEAIATCRAVVSLRYHGAVVALAAATPVLAIAYEQKTVGLMQWAGLPDACLHLDDLDPHTLASALTRLVQGQADRLSTERLALLRHDVETDLLDLQRALIAAPFGSGPRPLPALCDASAHERLVRNHLARALQRSRLLTDERDAGIAREALARRHIATAEAERDAARSAHADSSEREAAAAERIAELEADIERLREAANSTEPVHNL